MSRTAGLWHGRGPASLVREERGVSLVELLVGVGIAAGIMTLIGTFIFQFFAITHNGTERMAVSSDLQSAALWLGRDAAEAEDFTAGSAPTYGSFTAPQSAAEHVYLYRYDSAEQDLVRDLYIDGSLDSSRVVARFIQDQGDVTFSPNGDLVTVTLTSTSGGASETIDLELALRVR